MAVVMTSLSRAPNGDWFSRKGIPADVRTEYKAAFGVAFEERFRRPGALSATRAKQEFREWDATVTSRIESLRAARRGDGRTLTRKECHALAGEWYAWFVALYEDEPGHPDDWHRDYERLIEVSEPEHLVGESPESPLPAWARSRVRATVTELARVPSFLAETGIALAPGSLEDFLDVVGDDLAAAIKLLMRRADGDYGLDARPERFPTVPTVASAKPAGFTCWSLFEAWVNERKPAASTVDRWRSVFMALEERFSGRDIATITEDEAIEWKGTLVTEDRSAVVANDIWLTAARTVFG